MDFEFTEEQDRFRRQIVEFLDREVTREVVEESDSGMGLGPHSLRLMRKLGERRWLAPSFPEEYGGLGLSRTYRYIVQRELDYRNALAFIKGLGLVGVDMAAPIILKHGSADLKREILPRIAGGEVELALGYSEPNAGSDLSSLAMRAVEDGDDYVITGQKIFQSHSHFSEYHWLAARTDAEAPRHKGISLFVVDLASPGITISPLWEMSGLRTNEVFYDGVRVPKRRLVGEENKGWYYVASALDLERTLTIGYLEWLAERLIEHVRGTSRDGVPLSKDPLVRQRIADMVIELRVAHNLARRVTWLQDKGTSPIYETSELKLFIGELFQHVAQAAMEVAGLYGQLKKGSRYAILDGLLESFYKSAFLPAIGGGTSEIMRNMIAQRGLGLPQG